MRRKWLTMAGVMCLAWAGGTVARAADQPAAPAEAKAPDAKTDTATAERGAFEVVLELKGAFEPVEATVLDGRPESFTQPLEIVKVAPHGARVAVGDVILELAADKIDRAIADLDVELAVGEKALEIARRDLAAAESLHPLEMDEAERLQRIATEDLADYTRVGRAMAEEMSRFDVKYFEQNLRSSREELAQLEKMYKDKDLTEETEEMILERTRFEVEMAEVFLRMTKVSSEHALTLEIPRRAVELDRGARQAAIALEKARATLPLQLEQKRLGLAKQEHDRTQSLRKREELLHDRGLAIVKAPRPGVVYYGRLQDGSWTTGAVAGKATVGQAVPPGELAFTVCAESPVRFRAKIEEKDLHMVAPGQRGGVTPTGYPDVQAAVALEPGFSPVPKDGKYEAAFAVTAPAAGGAILPGMTGTARFVVRSRPDAITLPEGAVFREGEGGRVVYVDRADAAPEKRAVKTGLTSGGRTEILEGLAAGDRVRAKKP